jgi:DNA invertase Pin-like site-specific DNA recombinase
MRAGAYARVSSVRQKDQHTIESQLRVLPDFIQRQGWKLVDTYIDDGKSAKAGKLEARDGLTRLLADVAARRLDVVVVVDVDRLTRAEDLTERGALLGAFQRAGVKIAVATSGQILDFTTTQGDLMGTLYAFFAAEENRKRRERTVAGKLTAIARGRKPAGPTPYGLRYTRADHAWSIDADEAALVNEMYQRSARGETCEAIGRDLDRRGVGRPRSGRWGRERVYAIITSRTYLGEWTADKRRGLVVSVPPIVDADLWRRTQARLAQSGRRGLDRTRYSYLAAKLAVCGVCGAPVWVASPLKAWRKDGVKRPDVAARYICSRRRKPLTDESRCALPLHPTALVDAQLWEAVADVLGRPDLIADVIRRRRAATADGALWQRDLAAATSHIDRLDRTETALLSRFRRGAISEKAMDAELTAIGREREAARLQAEAAERALARGAINASRVEQLEARVASLRGALDSLTPAERGAIVRELVEPGSLVLDRTQLRCRLGLLPGHLAPCMADGVSTSYVEPITVQVRASLRVVGGRR